jgi:hypothetical protein
VTHPIRSLVVAGSLVAAAALAGCGSSGSDASPSTTQPSTTAAPDTTTSEPATTSSTVPDQTTTTTADAAGPAGAVDCQALLQEYADVFDPDDLSGTVAFFRQYEPDMPADVAAATERLAVAYEEAGDLGSIDLGDVDLTADAQAFSDWTNDGCPAG